MTLKIAIQMDSIQSIDIDGDTTFALGLEAQLRGFELFYYNPDMLSLHNQNLFSPLQSLKLKDTKKDYFELQPPIMTPLSEMDVILIRQDPPINMSYITSTYLLEYISKQTILLNNPSAIRNMPEKIFSLQFENISPPTLISRDIKCLNTFRKQQREIVIKPLYECGGAGIFHIKKEDDNFNALIELLLKTNLEPIILQKYLPEIKQGDKRILLVEGEAVGAMNRIPPKDDLRANLHVGGTAQVTNLSKRDHKICDTIGSFLKDNGVIFAGIDIIGDYLTEINISSPTGIRDIKNLFGKDIAVSIWDSVLKRLNS